MQTRVRQPGNQLAMERRRSEEAVVVDRPVGRVEHKRSRLPPVEASVAADELLERRDLTGSGIQPRVEDEVTDVRHRVEPTEICRGIGSERREGIVACDLAPVEVMDAGRAERNCAVGLRPNEDEADAVVGHQAVDEPRKAGLKIRD